MSAHTENALQFVRLAQDDLAGRSHIRRRGRIIKAVAVALKIVRKDLEEVMKSQIAEAKRDLREAVLDALGPDLRYGEVVGARKALTMVADLLPEYPNAEARP